MVRNSLIGRFGQQVYWNEFGTDYLVRTRVFLSMKLLSHILRVSVRLLAAVAAILSFSLIGASFTISRHAPGWSARSIAARITLIRIDEALDQYRADIGRYPDEKIGLKALLASSQVSLIDPWGRPYLYEISNDIPEVRSLGADGKLGGALDDGDLSSQRPMAPVPESRWHKALRFLRFQIFPWILFGTSLYVWFLARPRER